jgi:transcriptional regulator GlxA family with amidase domain
VSSLRHVVAYAPAGVVTLALGLATAVFRARPELHDMDLTLCTDTPGPVATDLGVPVLVRAGLRPLSRADLVLVLPAGGPNADPSPALRAALRRAHARGAVIGAHCAGVFTLAGTGLLEGRSATTHWQYAAALARRHPALDVRPEALYVDEGALVTGAGAAAGADLYLHLVRREHGAALANSLARLLVVPPHRSGDQQQYVELPVAADADGDRLAGTLAWARAHLPENLTIDELAAHAVMSRRSFIRHFQTATGTTPHQWLLHQRLDRAEQLLETTPWTVDEIAHRTGFGSAATLRERFGQRRGTSPGEYRRSFRREAPPRTDTGPTPD